MDRREWITQGMGRCIVVIEQRNLPEGLAGMLITSHDTELNYFRLHILIGDRLCNKADFENRVEQKITAVHEFTHAVAALSAISRVSAKHLIKLLEKQFRKKAHAINYNDIKQVASELSASLSIKLGNQKSENREDYFPDEHFRLGFENFPISYPVIFKEFLLSRELFDEYFSKDIVKLMCKAIAGEKSLSFTELVSPLISKIAKEKALNTQFVAARVLDIFTPIYANS